MDTEPNLPNRPNGELPSQDGQEQQHSSTSLPTSFAAPEVTSQGQKQPRRFSSGFTALIVVLVVLLAGGSGLIYYITIYQPNVQHTQATATALAQSTTIANANATSTDQALAIVTSIANANDTATATAPMPIVENTSGVPLSTQQERFSKGKEHSLERTSR